MYAPPGVDSDSSSGEEITPPSSSGEKKYPRFSLKSTFKPGRVRPPVLSRRSSTTNSNLTPETSPSKEARAPGATKKKVRIFVDGDEPLAETTAASEELEKPSSVSLSAEIPQTTTPSPAPPSSDRRRNSKGGGLGKEVLTLLQQLVAETAEHRAAQATANRRDHSVIQSPDLHYHTAPSRPVEGEASVAAPGPPQAPHSQGHHLNESYYHGYPPPAPYQGHQNQFIHPSLPVNQSTGYPHHAPVPQPHPSLPYPAPQYHAPPVPPLTYPHYPASPSFSAPPYPHSPYPFSPPPAYPVFFIPYPLPSAPPQISHTPVPAPAQPTAPNEPTRSADIRDRTAGKTGKQAPQNSADIPKKVVSRKAEGKPPSSRVKEEEKMEGSGRKRTGGLNPEEVSEAVRRATLARAGETEVPRDQASRTTEEVERAATDKKSEKSEMKHEKDIKAKTLADVPTEKPKEDTMDRNGANDGVKESHLNTTEQQLAAKKEERRKEKLTQMKLDAEKKRVLVEAAGRGEDRPQNPIAGSLPPPSPLSPDDVFKKEARRRHEASKKDKEAEIRKREELKRRMAEKGMMERAARRGEWPQKQESVRKELLDREKNKAGVEGPSPWSQSRPQSKEVALAKHKEQIPSLEKQPAEISLSPEQLTWSKALVSLASCIDLVQELMVSLHPSGSNKRRTQEHALGELLPRMLHALLSQQDMMATMRDVHGPQHASSLTEFGRNIKIISLFLVKHKPGQHVNDPKHLEHLEKKSMEAFESGSVLVVLQHLMQFSEHLSPTIFDTIKSLMHAWRKDGLTIKNVIQTIMLIKKELAAIEDAKDRKKKGKEKKKDGGGVEVLLEKLLGLLVNDSHSGDPKSTKSERRLTPLDALIPRETGSNTQGAKREREEKHTHKHREKLKEMMKSLGEKLHSSEEEPESPPHGTAPLAVKKKVKTNEHSTQRSSSPPIPSSSERRRESVSSSSCYSDDSEGTVLSDNEAKQLLATADSGPGYQNKDKRVEEGAEEPEGPAEDQVKRAEKVLMKDPKPRRVERGGKI